MLVTLTTDFGTRDPYVASMKGVLLSQDARMNLVDLSHEIAPQDVQGASLFIGEASLWFPAGTVHLVVVDPGVGTGRRAIAISSSDQYFVGPDNGVFTQVLSRAGLGAAKEISSPAILQRAVSATFHGRDVFAPAAAHLATGGAFDELGSDIKGGLVALTLPIPKVYPDGRVIGEVTAVDHFGNAITNIGGEYVTPGGVIVIDGQAIPMARTYGNVAPGAALALAGSAGLLEIAVRDGDAARVLGLRRGTVVELCALSGGTP